MSHLHASCRSFNTKIHKKCTINFSVEQTTVICTFNELILTIYSRILRFTTSMLLLSTIVCFSTINFCYVLQPFYLPFNKPKQTCGVYEILAIVGGMGHSLCFPIVFILAILTTVDRYEVMNFIHSSDPRKKRITVFTYILTFLGGFTIIFGGIYFSHPCFQIYDAYYVMYVIGVGLLSVIYGITDTVLNLLMIKQCVSKKLDRNPIVYEDTKWGRLLNKIGVKNQLYRYYTL